MAGFFSQAEIATQAKQEVNVDTLRSHCAKCKLNKNCKTPKMEISGTGRKEILIIGDTPSDTDDNNAIQFSGESGKYLADLLKKEGISLNRDCWKVNAVRCNNEQPTEKLSNSAKLCSGYIEKIIYEKKPKLTLILGTAGLATVYPEFKERTVSRWRNLPIPDEKYNTVFFSTFHPRDVLIKQFDYNFKSCFERDIKSAISKLRNTTVKREDYTKRVKVLTDFNSVVKLLNRVLMREELIYFDYEATGLKPYKPGHKIVSIGLALSPTNAYSFPYDFNSFWTKKEISTIRSLWRKILASKKIKKVAHNIKFEDMWSAIIFDVRPTRWCWDTMMAAHIIDNRTYFSGLKFQTFIHWGVRPYDEHMKKYLRSKEKGGFNTVLKAPLKELLIYNGLDCAFGFMLYEIQKSKLNGRKGLINANSFFTRGLLTMGSIQLNGIQMDEKYYSDQRQRLMFRVKKLRRQLMKGREARAFLEHFGRPLNITSDNDLGKLFYEVLGAPAVKTAKGNYKTDKDTLNTLNLPFVDKLLQMKRLEKARGTYLGQFAREVFDGKMHPFFDLHIPVSYRSSSSNPNFQNLPKRDAEIKRIIREGIIPRFNCVLGEIDFSGAEVSTSLCYHKDKNFHNYLIDKTTDMHRDQALKLWMLDRHELENPDFTREQHKLAKKVRFFAKNDWTFAQFYGDWYDSCGRTLWEDSIEQNKLVLPSGMPLRDHINNQGIYDVEQFVEHCKICEDDLWNKRFPEYTQWKKDIVKFYQKTGYIETYFGFRFQGYMDKKQCTNFPIQGTSFHMLVKTLIEIEKFIIRNKLKTKIIGQIHDSVISDIYIPELQFYLQGVRDIVSGLQDSLKWLIVPMEVEAEISLPESAGGSFAHMYEVTDKNIDKFDITDVYKDVLKDNKFDLKSFRDTKTLLRKAA